MSTVRYWPLLTIGGLLLIGMALGTWQGAMLIVPLLGISLLATVAGVGLASTRQWSSLLLPVAVLVLALGSGYALILASQVPVVLASAELVDQSAIVRSAPEPHNAGRRAYIDVTYGGQVVRLRATWDSPVGVRYGDVVTISGTIQPPRAESDFNERGFLLAHHAVGTFNATSVKPTGQRVGPRLLTWCHDVRDWLIGRLATSLTLPERTVVGGILLGDRTGFGDQLEQAFRDTGTTHILVVSGSNVVVIAATLQLLLAGLGRRWTASSVTLVLIGFVIISGADASVIRATMFYELVLLATLVGRRIHAATAIVAVALLMALHNPWILLYDVAFQLSFAAVFGLMTFGGWLYARVPVWLGAEYLAPALAAELTTLPVLVYHFGQVSLVAPLANLLVVPLVPAIMAGGVLSVALPWLRVIPWATEGLSTLLLGIVARLAALPASAVTLPSQHLLWTVAATVPLCIVLFWRQRARQRALPSGGLYGVE